MNELTVLSEAAAKISNEFSLIAFVVGALVWGLMSILKKKKSLSQRTTSIIMALVVAAVVLASLPFAARAYLVNRGVYRLRVTVEDPHGMPVNEAKVVSSIGGEPKKVEGGWEFDIPFGSKPRDGRLTVYAEVSSAFLTGQSEVMLGDDYNLAAMVKLAHDRSAHIHGRVIDRNQIPIASALVSVVGYEAEAITTGPLGQFELPAHASDGQQVEVSVFKQGLGSTTEWKEAGDRPVTIVLAR